jgi:hypothetical protein
MRLLVVGLAVFVVVEGISAQAPGKFPPDSLVNVQVFH